MSVYTFPVLAVLAVGARILTRQDGNGVNLLAVGLVVVHKVAAVALGARAAEEVVVAQLVRVLALLDGVHDGHVDDDGLVEPTRAGVPVGLLRRDLLVLRAAVARGRRGRRRRGRAAVGGGVRLGAGAGLVGRERDAHRRRWRAIGNSIGVRNRRRVGAAAAATAARGDTSRGAGSASNGSRGIGRGALDKSVGAEEVLFEAGRVGAGGLEVGREGSAALDDADAITGRGVGAEEVLDEDGVASIVGDTEEDLLAVVILQVPANVV